MQFEHILAAPEDLSNNVDMLAKTWKDILLKANTARVCGTNGVGKIIDEVSRTVISIPWPPLIRYTSYCFSPPSPQHGSFHAFSMDLPT